MFNMLDVGCGDTPRGNVNVDVVRSRRKRGASFLYASALYLPFRNSCFNLVYSRALLEHLEDPECALKEMFRVSKREVFVIIPHRYFRKHPKGHIQFFSTLQVKEWIYRLVGHYPIMRIVYRCFPFEWLPLIRLPHLLEIRILLS